jgi:hypothetical protein
MKQFNFTTLPCGFIVGEAELIDVKQYKTDEEFNKDQNLHLATKGWGDYGFILKNAKRIQPIPINGSLGFWEFKQ